MIATPSNRKGLKPSTRNSWRDETPLGFADGSNKYRYAGNDPINFRDPTGLRAAGNPLRNLRRIATRAVTTAVRAFNPLLSATVDAGVGLATSFVNSRPSGLRPKPSTVAAKRPAADPPKLVRQIVPGLPIVPRLVRDLPGVRAALENPQRFAIANHRGQGNFVVDIKDGSVRFVTGSEVQPIETRLHLAREAARNAAQRGQALTVTQEGLIAISPLHETARDIGIAAFGRDPFEPGRRFDSQERLGAFVFSAVPGGDSSKIRYVDKVTKGFQQIRLFDLPPLKRGRLDELDPRLLPKGRQGLPFNFEVIDALPGTSVTTIDISKKSYQTASGIINRVNSKTGRLSRYPAKNLQLRIGIPDDVPLTKVQSEAFGKLKQVLKEQRVRLEVIPIN